MNIVIIGVGKVGLAIVERLSKEEHDIVVIDKDGEAVERAVNDYDVKGVVGNGANYELQTEAGVRDADLVLACTPSDEINLLCCMVAKKLGASATVARTENPEYFSLFKGGDFEINLMINPDYEAAMEIRRILEFPSAIKVARFADGRAELVELKLDENSLLSGVALSELEAKIHLKILICAVQRGNKIIIPSGDLRLQQGDMIYVLSSRKNIEQLFKVLNTKSKSARSVIMVGGSKIAYYLAKELEKSGVRAKIIDRNPEVCNALSISLEKAEIINADGTDQDLLLEQGITKSDAVICLTDHDDLNIILALYCHSKNVKKVIAKVNKSSYYFLLEGSGVESIVSPKTITADQIVRYARSLENVQGSAVKALYGIFNGKAEVLEFIVTNKFRMPSVPLKHLELIRNLLIACIIRGDTLITPGGDNTIEVGDRVIVVTTRDSLDDLNDILG